MILKLQLMFFFLVHRVEYDVLCFCVAAQIHIHIHWLFFFLEENTAPYLVPNSGVLVQCPVVEFL